MSQQQSLAVEVLPPGSVRAAARAEFTRMVIEAGEVDPVTLPGLMDRALCLGFARLHEVLVGVGGIKRPNPNYRAAVFAKAHAKQDPSQYQFELGWVVVMAGSRKQGLGSKLVGELVSNLEGASAYATSRVDNCRMHSSLRRFGFELTGTAYPSEMNEPDIQLFIYR